MKANPSQKVDSAQCIELLKNLVSIASYSGQEKEASLFLVDQFKSLGFDRYYTDSVDNAIGVRGSDSADKTIVLLGHIDTVPGDIPVRIEDGRLFGRGSVDAKGPLATFTLAASQVELPDNIRLVVAGAVEEESATSKGARQIAKDFQADYCVIGEPSGFTGITLGYKGRILIDYSVEVGMAHSAGPEPNAPELATDFWQFVLRTCHDFNADRPKLFQQLLPSLRSIRSDTDGIRSSAECRMGVRLPPEFEIDTFRDQLENAAHVGELKFRGYEPAYQSNRSHALCQALAAAIRAEGQTPKYKLKTGTADMNVVAPIWNCPMVAYGPGDSRLDHTPNEHIELDEFIQAIQILKTAITKLAHSLANG